MSEETTVGIISPGELEKAMLAVFKLAQTDAGFRKLCMESPGDAIYQIAGKRLPAGATLSFTEPEKPEEA